MLVVGLTGGIGSGKTTVADRFAARGVPILDADVIAHELVEPGQPTLAAIVAAFGADLLTPEGRLDRPRLRGLVFADPARRTQLEAIVHPAVRRRLEAGIAALRAPYCLVVIPLLFEAGLEDLVDRVLVVDVPPAVQITRVTQRDGVARSSVESIMAAQLSRAERLARADDVVNNGVDLATLESRIEALDRFYRRFAESGSGGNG
jgi:dephospho-CoA kinase